MQRDSVLHLKAVYSSLQWSSVVWIVVEVKKLLTKGTV